MGDYVFGTAESKERILWAAVLSLVARDLCRDTGMWRASRIDAERWIGSYPSREFSTVVSLAGLDPDAVWEQLDNLRSQTIEQRACWYAQVHEAEVSRALRVSSESVQAKLGAQTYRLTQVAAGMSA